MKGPGSVLAVFASLNQVALLKRALYRNGIYVEMIRTPKCLASTGCSFALRCTARDLNAVRDACTTARICCGGLFEEHMTQGGVQYQANTQDSANDLPR